MKVLGWNVAIREPNSEDTGKGSFFDTESCSATDVNTTGVIAVVGEGYKTEENPEYPLQVGDLIHFGKEYQIIENAGFTYRIMAIDNILAVV